MSEDNYHDYTAGYEKGFSDGEARWSLRVQALEKMVEELKKTPNITALESRVQWLKAELDRATAGVHWKLGPLEE